MALASLFYQKLSTFCHMIATQLILKMLESSWLEKEFFETLFFLIFQGFEHNLLCRRHTKANFVLVKQLFQNIIYRKIGQKRGKKRNLKKFMTQF